MVAFTCSGGTGCYANHCSCHGGYVTDTSSASKWTITLSSGSSAASFEVRSIEYVEADEDFKARMREWNREMTLAAQAWLAWLHDQVELEEGYPRVVRYRRPGRRRTCTAVKNFRRAA